MFYSLYDPQDRIIGTQILTKNFNIRIPNWKNEEYQSRTNLCDSGYKFYIKSKNGIKGDVDTPNVLLADTRFSN